MLLGEAAWRLSQSKNPYVELVKLAHSFGLHSKTKCIFFFPFDFSDYNG